MHKPGLLEYVVVLLGSLKKLHLLFTLKTHKASLLSFVDVLQLALVTFDFFVVSFTWYLIELSLHKVLCQLLPYYSVLVNLELAIVVLCLKCPSTHRTAQSITEVLFVTLNYWRMMLSIIDFLQFCHKNLFGV